MLRLDAKDRSLLDQFVRLADVGLQFVADERLVVHLTARRSGR